MKTAYLVFKILMGLPEVLRVVESLWPEGTGNGKDKLAFARGLLEDIFGGLESVWPVVEKLIARLVGRFNDSGEFDKDAG